MTKSRIELALELAGHTQLDPALYTYPGDTKAETLARALRMCRDNEGVLANILLHLVDKQAKVPTALDEMRALPGATDANRCDPAECDKVQSRLIRELEETREALVTQQARANQLEGQLEVVTQGLAETREALARVEAERDDLADCARNAEVARRHLGETLGMMHEPSMGPAWPASWDALVEQVREMMGSVGAHVELGETTEKLAWMTTDRDEWKEAAEEVATELRKRDAVVLEISAAWSRYQRNDMSREEFEGTVAERIESYISQAASEAEVTERAIVVGSTWEHIGPERWGIVAVESLGGRKVCYSSERVSGCRDEAFFRASFTWVSDPEATESATKGAK